MDFDGENSAADLKGLYDSSRWSESTTNRGLGFRARHLRCCHWVSSPSFLLPDPFKLISTPSISRDKNKIIYNAQCGHMLRTKLEKSNEGGVAAGSGALDSPYLTDEWWIQWNSHQSVDHFFYAFWCTYFNVVLTPMTDISIPGKTLSIYKRFLKKIHTQRITNIFPLQTKVVFFPSSKIDWNRLLLNRRRFDEPIMIVHDSNSVQWNFNRKFSI